MPGAIGPFRLLSELGKGGMGVVHLAIDTRLDRQVAVKALPDSVATDPDRLARFQREAKVLAALNHPNIAAIHGLEEHDDRQYLILEYIDGENLADRLQRGPLPLDEALHAARQIVEALEAAHEKGVVHRDLKPANVMLRADGAVKVLDFGLARTADGTPSSTSFTPRQADSPTLTTPHAPLHSPTIPGVIMGTAGYMSPEQARGRAVDKRSDLFSFGCVLFEMLSGAQPFPGETPTDSIGAILHKEPDWAILPPNTPPIVRNLLRRCLAKDRRHRLHDAGDARLDLEQAIADPSDASGALATVHSRRGVPLVIAVLLGILAVALGAAIGRFSGGRTPQSNERPTVAFDILPPSGPDNLTIGEGVAPMCINRAGDSIVFAATTEGVRKLHVRSLSNPEPRVLPGTEGAYGPTFSPDGKWVVFGTEQGLMKVPFSGGPALQICSGRAGSTSAWLDDGTILFGSSQGILRVSSDGGTPQLLAPTGPDVRTSDGATRVLGVNGIEAVPGQRYALANAWDGDTIQSYTVLTASLDDGSLKTLLRNATDARFVAPDRIVFLRESSVMAVPFDLARARITGDAVQVIDGVLTSRWADAAYWGVSQGGTLAYVPGARSGPGRRLIHVDASGKATPLMDGVDAIVGGIRTSPDGRYVALTTLRQRVELWVYNFERRAMTLISAEGESWGPTWSSDSNSLFFMQVIPGVPARVVRKDIRSGATGAVQVIVDTQKRGDVFPLAATPDGKRLLLVDRSNDIKTPSRMVTLVLPSPGADGPSATYADLTPVTGSTTSEGGGLLSPDGSLLSYTTDESGREEVYVRTFDPLGPRFQVSTAGGTAARWSRDGKRLYFADLHDALFAADITTAGGLKIGTPVRLFDIPAVATTSLWGVYDTLPDGGFVMVAPAPWETAPTRLRVILNWTDQMRRQSAPGTHP